MRLPASSRAASPTSPPSGRRKDPPRSRALPQTAAAQRHLQGAGRRTHTDTHGVMTPPPTWLLDHRARWHESRVAYAEFSCYGGGGPPFDLMEAKLNVPSVRPGTVPKTDVIAGLRASTDEPAQDKAPGRRAWKPGWAGHPSGVMPAHPSSGESGQHRAVRWRWADSAVEQGRGDDDRVPGAGSPAAQRGRAGGGRVYFAPEAHAAYEALGFAGSPVSQDGVARPELKSYFTSRGACMGQVPGEVVAAAFGCFNPKFVVPGVAAGWQITSRATILQAREQ